MAAKEPATNIIPLIHLAGKGDRKALDELIPLIYDELRNQARAVRRRGPDCSVQTGTLIHEAFLKMTRQERIAALKAVKERLDPKGILKPGKLLG